MNTVIKQIIKSPRLNLYVRKLDRFIIEERRKRQKFYEMLDDNSNMEFINGEIIMHSPIKLCHSEASDSLYQLLKFYVDLSGLGEVRHEKLMISLTRNDYEPDISFFSAEKYKEFSREQMKFPAPDFIVEVTSPSTEKYDRGVKFEDYAAHGVKEYWIIDPEEKTIEQYLLKDRKYFLNVKVQKGIIESRVIKGFKISVEAVFDNVIRRQVMQEILMKASL